jgi:hypothetical protein
MLKKIFSAIAHITRNLGEKQRGNAHAFAKHVSDVFQPHPSLNELEEEETLIHLL